MEYIFSHMKTPELYREANIENIDTSLAERVKKMGEERKMEKGFYLFGEVGRGKTYTAYAIYNYLLNLRLNTRVVNSLDIVKSIKKTFAGLPDYESPEYENIKDHMDFLNDLEQYQGLLIIDDIGTEKDSEAVQVRYFQLIDYRYENKFKMSFTSNLSLGELEEKMGERITSRVAGSCEYIKLTGENKRI